MGWIASWIILLGMWGIAHQKRVGFLISFVGEVLWGFVGYSRDEPDLVVVCIVFAIMQGYAYFKWGKAPRCITNSIYGKLT